MINSALTVQRPGETVQPGAGENTAPPMVMVGGGEQQTVVITEGSRRPPPKVNDLSGTRDWDATLYDCFGDWPVCMLLAPKFWFSSINKLSQIHNKK